MSALRLAALALAAATTLPCLALAETQAALTPPPGLKFYSPPAEAIPGTPGSVIWSRKLVGAAALKGAGSNELVLYRSTSVHDKPIAVSGIVALPKGTAPAGGWPVITWAHGTVGSADKCAPSRDAIGSPAYKFNQAPHRMLNAFLKEGWAVVMTDYEGLGTEGPHPYLLGLSEARGVLDILLAARELHPEISKKVAIVGHSQGGQAALFAAAEAKARKDELELRGVLALAPASFMGTLFWLGTQGDEPGEGMAFPALFLTGALAGNADLKKEDILSEEGLRLFPEVETKCRVELSKTGSWGSLIPSKMVKENANLTPLMEELRKMHPGDLSIDVPVRIVQGLADERVSPIQTTLLIEQLTHKGTKIELRVYPLMDHFGVLARDVENAKNWLKQRLE
ncbi:alpha/beta fold hydrolase [Stigmatella sp. ncwal1]|uniref:Alpha/beta fold hydrolase n=1 Tax=Stigmatella ashevillensis TaxID=2995309 RepID=A0ABT5D1N0_9BACT|nr:alpha/beta fold hydrolase [Stigmatella ashevillena]MDC0707576.1 alpha/beta fold hydrolase [Stigmatella ashevillena]